MLTCWVLSICPELFRLGFERYGWHKNELILKCLIISIKTWWRINLMLVHLLTEVNKNAVDSSRLLQLGFARYCWFLQIENEDNLEMNLCLKCLIISIKNWLIKNDLFCYLCFLNLDTCTTDGTQLGGALQQVRESVCANKKPTQQIKNIKLNFMQICSKPNHRTFRALRT